ncbi:hypothetical protein AAH172_15775, partial [Bacteroides xylanisolvens]|uniref:hypothetical protein n=1 Tax=Bacteroides xylanisolvens TaxID=371601 RepID=UPI0039B409C1
QFPLLGTTVSIAWHDSFHCLARQFPLLGTTVSITWHDGFHCLARQFPLLGTTVPITWHGRNRLQYLIKSIMGTFP